MPAVGFVTPATSPTTSSSTRSFRSMGCRAHVVVTSGGERSSDDVASTDDVAALDHAVTRLHDLERLWSRFVDTSDITRANRAAGTPVAVDADTLAVVLRALEAWRQTRGRFDITVLPALVHHGYTHSATGTTHAAAPSVCGQLVAVCGLVEVDPFAGTLTVPAGSAIDLGGIGKGFAADMVARELLALGCAGALVNIGGDIAVGGRPADGPDWVIGIDDPLRTGTHVATLALGAGGIATSGTTVRRWTNSTGETAHHLIDPTTAMPARTDVLTATVVAADAATAEAFATAAMLVDATAAVEMLDAVGLAGSIVTADGRVHSTASMEVFAR